MSAPRVLISEDNGKVLRHPIAERGLIKQIQVGKTTLYEHFRKSVALFGQKNYLGMRESLSGGKWGDYKWKTYSEVDELSHEFASGVRHMQMITPLKEEGAQYEFIGIFSKNREEWTIAELGAMRQNLIVVALYETLGEEAIQTIINETQMTTICCNTETSPKILNLKEKTPSVRFVIQFETPEAESVQKAKDLGISLFGFSEVIQKGKDNLLEDNPPTKEDYYMFSYTSGTTGVPKGVMIKHESMLAEIAGLVSLGICTTPKDVHLSFLPFAHVYEKLAFYLLTFNGSSIGFYHGVTTEMMEDAKLLKPTVFTGVPRLFNRIYDGVWKKVNSASFLKRAVFKLSLWLKLKGLKNNKFVSILDSFAFKEIKNGLGGRVKKMTTGSAPIDKEVLNFLMACFSAPILEGYGQTESMGVCSIVNKPRMAKGHVGYPIPSVEIKLQELEEMEGKHLMYRGPIRMTKYFKRDQDNEETLDSEGWLKTGDLCVLCSDGGIKVVDRIKNFFKLSQGEYVAPEKLENVYLLCESIQQIFVTGHSNQNYTVAIVVPELSALKKHFANIDTEALYNSEETKKYVWKEMMATADHYKLSSLEKPLQLQLSQEPFSEENGLLTPTQKIKRPQANKHFSQVIQELYSKPPLKSS